MNAIFTRSCLSIIPSHLFFSQRVLILLSTLLTCLSGVFSQAYKVSIPGASFSIERSDKPSSFEDVSGGGRKFRANAFATIYLKALLHIPPQMKAENQLQRITVHFRSSKTGPSLRSMEIFKGTAMEFKKQTNIKGDYTTIENSNFPEAANSWQIPGAYDLSNGSAIRLTIMFPGGFDSQVDPGEFVLTAVEASFPAKSKSLAQSTTSIIINRPTVKLDQTIGSIPVPTPIATRTSGVIYGIAGNGDLSWYKHLGVADGSTSWEGPKKVGTGWQFKHVFNGDNGVVYAITNVGELRWYRHTGKSDGTARWQGPTTPGTGWNFTNVFSGNNGVIYAVSSTGDLTWYKHLGNLDGSTKWLGPKKVGSGWIFKQVFAVGNGVIYAINNQGELMWYRHTGENYGSNQWEGPKKVGSGWSYKEVFAGSNGVIYGITTEGALMWYRHTGQGNGTAGWEGPKKVGSGWNFKEVISR